MAKQRMVSTRFWSDSFIVDKCNALDRLLFLYLLTNERTNIIGIYEVPIRTAAFETGIDKDDIEKMLTRLSPKVEYFDGWVYIRQFAEHQTYNPKIQLGMIAAWRGLPEKIKEHIHSLGVGSDRLSKAIKGYAKSMEQSESEFKSKSKDHSNNNKHGAKIAPTTKKPKKPDSIVAKLYYEAIKALDVPVRNNNNVWDKIHELEREDDQQKVINYLTFMRDEYAALVMERKPHINEALDIYAKRQQIRHLLELERRQKAGTRYE